jgi:hypothetical protein
LEFTLYFDCKYQMQQQQQQYQMQQLQMYPPITPLKPRTRAPSAMSVAIIQEYQAAYPSIVLPITPAKMHPSRSVVSHMPRSPNTDMAHPALRSAGKTICPELLRPVGVGDVFLRPLAKRANSAPDFTLPTCPGKAAPLHNMQHTAIKTDLLAKTGAQAAYAAKLALLLPPGVRRTPVNAKAQQEKKKTKPQPVVEPTLHLKATSQQLNYKAAQKLHHSKKHRRTSMVGSMQYCWDGGSSSGGADLVSPAALDAACRMRPLGDTPNKKHTRLAIAHTLAVRLKTQKSKLNVLFREFDSNQNGSLELSEFVNMLEMFCPGELRAKDAAAFMQLLDKNNDGEVSMEEFKSFVESFSKDSRENGAGEWQRSKPAKWKTQAKRFQGIGEVSNVRAEMIESPTT